MHPLTLEAFRLGALFPFLAFGWHRRGCELWRGFPAHRQENAVGCRPASRQWMAFARTFIRSRYAPALGKNLVASAALAVAPAIVPRPWACWQLTSTFALGSSPEPGATRRWGNLTATSRSAGISGTGVPRGQTARRAGLSGLFARAARNAPVMTYSLRERSVLHVRCDAGHVRPNESALGYHGSLR